MVSYRAVAFILGGVGLLAFAAAGAWAFTAAPDAACAGVQCKKESLARHEFPIAVLAALGAILEGVGALFLWLQMRSDRRLPRKAPASHQGRDVARQPRR